MEYLDLFDQNGNKTGQSKLRSEVHKDGDWHKVIDVWVINPKNQTVLIQKRAADKESWPNLWEISCSGHISAGEESLPSAIRELEEEVGIKAEPSQLEFLFTLPEEVVTNNGTFINNEFKDVYLLKGDYSMADVSLQKEEVADAKFISLSDFEKELQNNVDDFVPHEKLYKESFKYLQ